ncbi:MAG TPA: HEAT repeat domain-containing protein [Bacteroidia bacterium]|nr:HEAT repeat domain-containing protein [Bacteroidia bacterium]HQW23967.1 HEAT repeat domain-containing protein [Bacteroidia bacterium]
MLQLNFNDLQYSVDEVGRSIYSFPVHIRILIGVTILFMLIILILLAVIMGSRIFKTKRSNKKAELHKKYQPVFRNLIFEEALDRNKVLSMFDRIDLDTPFNRTTILDEIIHLHENFTGETAERLEEIYTFLEFEKDSMLKLKSKRWYIIAKGMKELAIMNVKSGYTEISGFLNSKNEILRMETRIALMKLSDTDPLAFLSKETEHLSDWDSANIYNMLTKMPEKMIPDFSNWLNSPNRDVVVFCIQMIGRFRQRESIKTLLVLLKSPDLRIKLCVIKALRELSATDGEEPLLEIYPLENLATKSEILKTLEVIGSAKSVPVLEKIIRQPIEDYPVSIQAVRSLLSIHANGEQIIETIFNQSGPQLQLMIRHARDRRL